MSNILLINDNIKDFDKIIKACNKNTYSITYNQNTDTYDSIFVKYQSLLNDPSNSIQTINHVALVSHGIPGETFSFLEKEEKMLLSKYIYNEKETTNSDNAEIPEPSFVDGSGISASQQLIKSLNNLETWSSFKEFIQKFNIQKSLDFLGCALLQSTNWKYILSELETEQHLNLNIRASDDDTGNIKVGGDWVLESDNVNIKELYFDSELIEEYTGRFFWWVIAALIVADAVAPVVAAEASTSTDVVVPDPTTGTVAAAGAAASTAATAAAAAAAAATAFDIATDAAAAAEAAYYAAVQGNGDDVVATAAAWTAAEAIKDVAFDAAADADDVAITTATAAADAAAAAPLYQLLGAVLDTTASALEGLMLEGESTNYDGGQIVSAIEGLINGNSDMQKFIDDSTYLGGARPWNIPTMKIIAESVNELSPDGSFGDIRYNTNTSAVEIWHQGHQGNASWKDLSLNEQGNGRTKINKNGNDRIKDKTFITYGGVLSGYDESELLIAGGGGWDGIGVFNKRPFSNYPSDSYSYQNDKYTVSPSYDAFKAFNNNDDEFWLSSKNSSITSTDVSYVILGINFPTNTYYKITAFTIKEPDVSGGSFRFTSNDASLQNSPMYYNVQGLPYDASNDTDDKWMDLYIASKNTYVPVYSNGYATAVGIDGSGGIGGSGGIDVTRIPIDSAIVHDSSNNSLDHVTMTDLKNNREKIYKSVRLKINKGITDISFVTDSSGVTVGELLIYGTAYNYRLKGKLKIKGTDIDIVGNNNAVMALSHGGVPRLAIGSWSHIALPSDDRLKHNEEVIQNSLDLIEQLKPYKYQKTDKMYDAGYNGIIHDKWIWEIGLIAQDVSAIPYLNFMVNQMANDGMYTLSYFNLIGLLIQGAKDLYNENKSLKKDIVTCKKHTQDLSGSLNVTIDELNNKVEELESLVLALEN